MWTRAELKAEAKAVLRGSYWESFAAGLIVTLVTAAAAYLVSLLPSVDQLASILLTLFLIQPAEVGLYCFFMQVRLAPPNMRHLLFPFKSGVYMKVVGTSAWRQLFLMLWALIPAVGITAAILPGVAVGYPLYYASTPALYTSGGLVAVLMAGVIVLAGMIILVMKQYAYSMTSYILTDNPHIGYRRALRLSVAMTYGHKWKIFVLGLSFLGWTLLSALTLFIGLIFLMPYISATFAALYARLRDNALRSGLCTPEELNMYVR